MRESWRLVYFTLQNYSLSQWNYKLLASICHLGGVNILCIYSRPFLRRAPCVTHDGSTMKLYFLVISIKMPWNDKLLFTAERSKQFTNTETKFKRRRIFGKNREIQLPWSQFPAVVFRKRREQRIGKITGGATSMTWQYFIRAFYHGRTRTGMEELRPRDTLVLTFILLRGNCLFNFRAVAEFTGDGTRRAQGEDPSSPVQFRWQPGLLPGHALNISLTIGI